MKNYKNICLRAFTLITAAAMLAGCGSSAESDSAFYETGAAAQDAVMNDMAAEAVEGGVAEFTTQIETQQQENTEEYNYIEENGYVSVAAAPLSTFSADVDTASYTNIRRMIYDDLEVPVDAVRIEEMINYFDYSYSEPENGEPFSVYTELSDCPWNDQTQLFMASINTKSLDAALGERPASNLVFLIDVSGSMYDDNKLPLVQKAFTMLTENLTAQDRVSIVTYAGSDAVLLEGADGNDADKILDVINSLEAGGSTAGAAGINTAYKIAEKYFIEGGNNRILLATDGDLNVGVSSESELTRLVEKKRESGVYLSVLGFGAGNYKDNRLEAIADHGNGNYSYIDTEKEAEKVLVDGMCGTLFTVAKDVKFQLEFNPAAVKGYRLIGYENRKMAAEDFADDTKDAGEVGAGHSVTVLYEIVPIDSEMELNVGDLKYSSTEATGNSDEILTVNIRYKKPDGDTSILSSYPVSASLFNEKMSADMTFAAGVAEFGMLLRDSRYIGDITYSNIATQLSEYDYSDDEFKDEFIYLVNTMKHKSDR